VLKEIGSNFWLNKNIKLENKEVKFDFLGIKSIDISFISTGRGAISYVLQHIKIPQEKKIALIPSFTCYSVIEPFLKAGYKVHYYNINKNLSIEKKSFIETIGRIKPSVVLLHGYFGFNTLNSIEDIIQSIREEGVIVIEDITQSLYSNFKHIAADYYVCSLRKWAPLPDGGCAISTKNPFSYKPIKQDKKLEKAKIEAFHAKYLYIEENIGIKDDFLKQFKEAEQILSEQSSIFAMSEISKKIQANLNIDFLRNRRKRNYSILSKELIDSTILESIFPNLPEEVTPSYFPVYVKFDRRKMQEYLAKHDIYAPVIWPKPSQCEGMIDSKVEWIYKHILAIPCDQRYDIDDMERIVQVLKSYEN